MLKPRKISDLGPAELAVLMERSAADVAEVFEYVRGIVEDVRRHGDEPILKWHAQVKADVTPAEFIAGPEETAQAYAQVPAEVVSALETAAANLTRFHQAQLERPMWLMESQPGVLLGRLTRPLDAVGCYAPGGTAIYPSSVLMTVIPAKVAGVGKVVVATPPRPGMVANPAVLVAADVAGADLVVKVGGPWAVAGLAFGTQTLPRVDKIVGPGNKYVTAAKLAVFGRVGIDSPAGPSEALILADETASPRLTALDFLSQLEHDADSGAVLVTTSPDLAEQVCRMIDSLLPDLTRREQLDASLARHAHVLLAEDLTQAVDFANAYSPEHLQILTSDPWQVLPRIRHAGSIFMGPHAPVPVGDYCSGTNHVLPTGGLARAFSGLSVDDFLKKPTFQYLSPAGLATLAPTVQVLAEYEGLPLHARAVQARFED